MDRPAHDRPVRIGTMTAPNPVFAAPMAGVTDLPFRVLAREQGCGLVYTEMLSDKALLFGNRRTERMVTITPEEHPIAVQLLGSEPGPMAEAARVVVEAGADIVDINLGCPAPKVVRNGEGSALGRDPRAAAMVVGAVVRAVDRPVTAKIRKGWSDEEVKAVELASRLEDAGAAAIAVHGRVRTQFYSGRADWETIGQVKAAVRVPVIGNGDVVDGPSAAAMIDQTGCDAVMIGRAALGNPWVFAQVLEFLRAGRPKPPPSPEERVAMAIRHLRAIVEHKGPLIGLLEMRKHAAWYIHGLHGAARVRSRLMTAGSPEAMEETLRSFLDDLNRPADG
ncbi:MAG: tRNA dihydrouridine synthase DusB [Bacillota bacterium]